MTEIVASRPRRPKHGGRQKGTPNRITVDLRRALRDLADANASRVQEWLDRVAESDPAEAIRLWLSLLRFVTPTLQAAAIADITRQAVPAQRLASLSDDELMAMILQTRPPVSRLEHAQPVTALPKLSESETSETDELLR